MPPLSSTHMIAFTALPLLSIPYYDTLFSQRQRAKPCDCLKKKQAAATMRSYPLYQFHNPQNIHMKRGAISPPLYEQPIKVPTPIMRYDETFVFFLSGKKCRLPSCQSRCHIRERPLCAEGMLRFVCPRAHLTLLDRSKSHSLFERRRHSASLLL